MGKSAKTYKRATRKEKIGLAASNAATIAASRPIKRHAPISATMNGSRTSKMLDERDGSALSQAANKLMIEAEKRAQAQQEGDNDDDEMEDDTATTTTATQQPKAGKRKSGAGGMKQKASRKGVTTTTTSDRAPKKDYVDMFEGRRKR